MDILFNYKNKWENWQLLTDSTTVTEHKILDIVWYVLHLKICSKNIPSLKKSFFLKIKKNFTPSTEMLQSAGELKFYLNRKQRYLNDMLECLIVYARISNEDWFFSKFERKIETQHWEAKE